MTRVPAWPPVAETEAELLAPGVVVVVQAATTNTASARRMASGCDLDMKSSPVYRFSSGGTRLRSAGGSVNESPLTLCRLLPAAGRNEDDHVTIPSTYARPVALTEEEAGNVIADLWRRRSEAQRW